MEAGFRRRLPERRYRLVPVGEPRPARRRRSEPLFRPASTTTPLSEPAVETLAEIVHDLSTPLAAVGTSVEALLRTDEASPPAERAALLRGLRENTRWLQELVADVCPTLAEGARQHRVGPFNLGTAVARATQAAEPLFQPRAQHLSLRLPRRPVVVWGDERLIRRVVLNLLANAAKYAPPAEPVTVQLRARGDAVVVEVEDRGGPLEPRARRRLFEAGVRGRSASDVPGHGLGLRIVRNLVAWHGGQVGWRAAGTGRGLIFWFSLPRLGAGGAPRQSHDAIAASA